ncbi:MAG: hypothetical protein ACRDJT_01400 [Actinomycetota bacterium]
MSVLSDPTVVIEQTPPTEIQLNGHEEGSPGATMLDAEMTETAPSTADGIEDVADLKVEAPAIPSVAPTPSVPLVPLRKRNVRGRYRSSGTGWQLELRVDVDGVRPMRMVSGDFFSTTGSTTSYFGSFIVKNPTVTTTTTEVKIQGTGTFTWSPSAPVIRVTIPRVDAFRSPKPATLQFITPPNTLGASYLCSFASSHFRSIQFEQDSVAGSVPFVSYNTGSLPQPTSSPVRTLTVPAAFSEAGIQLQVAGAPNVIPVSAAGLDAKWSDSELHNAMVGHFSLFANKPQWRVWMLMATSHVDDYRGIMFDYSDSVQRQGAAVFYDAIKGTSATSQRAQLRTYVHELGHAFNLLHSWQKNLADPPAPLGPNGGLGDLSWMNYAWKYQPPAPALGGEPAYWASFPFQFTDNELIHLRHGFYKNLIMGADPFGKGAAEVDPGMFEEPMEDNSGLALELRARAAFEYGEPVVVELKLSATDLRGRETHGYLHPNDDLVNVAIREPSGRTRVFQPMLRHCVDEDKTIQLDPGQPAIYDSAYIGFGKDGYYFAEPGEYALRAQYIARDGSRIASSVLRIRVRPPATKADERVGELLMGEQQGQLLALLGSESATLTSGNAALETLIQEHGSHPLAAYARLVKGVNAERDFKYLSADKHLEIKEARPAESVEMLSAVEAVAVERELIDNITLNMVMRKHARAEAKAGRVDQAVGVMDRMVSVFENKDLNPQVLQRIRQQAEATKISITDETDGDSPQDEE